MKSIFNWITDIAELSAHIVGMLIKGIVAIWLIAFIVEYIKNYQS